jgi:hypothetical protein
MSPMIQRVNRENRIDLWRQVATEAIQSLIFFAVLAGFVAVAMWVYPW